MDFSSRNIQQQTAQSAQSSSTSSSKKSNKEGRGKWDRIGITIIGAAIVILLIALVVFIGFSGSKSEDKYVDKNRLQAVFLNTGQVYFGNVKALNNKYLVLTNIYYLQAANGGSGDNASNAANNITLVKLGCELHEPFDQMVINSDQVTFWENLQDNGQVAKAVSTFEKQNPNGQKCADQSSSSSNNSTNAAQNAGSSNGSSSNNNNSNNSGN